VIIKIIIFIKIYTLIIYSTFSSFLPNFSIHCIDFEIIPSNWNIFGRFSILFSKLNRHFLIYSSSWFNDRNSFTISILHILFKSNSFSTLYIVEPHRYLIISIILLFHGKEKRIIQWCAWTRHTGRNFEHLARSNSRVSAYSESKLLL